MHLDIQCIAHKCSFYSSSHCKTEPETLIQLGCLGFNILKFTNSKLIRGGKRVEEQPGKFS